MTKIPAELLGELTASPFATVPPGAQVIIFVSGHWEPDQVQALGTYLQAWAPQVTWNAVYDCGAVGVLVIPAAPLPEAPSAP